MKVVHLTTVHRASDTRIFDRECRSLAAAGHDVTLIARDDRAEVISGVRVKSLPARRNRVARMTIGVWHAYRVARAEKADVYHLHDPELLAVAFLLGRGAKVIFDAHDDAPAQIIDNKDWVPLILRKGFSTLVRLGMPILMRGVDSVIAATEPIAKTTKARTVTIIRNHPRRPVAASGVVPFAERETAVAYVGGLTRVKGILELVQAMALSGPESRTVLHLAGAFEVAEVERSATSDEGWEAVRFHGWLAKRDVEELLGRCRAGVVTFLPIPRHVYSEPNKLFQYMAMGLPVIASDFDSWRDIVESAGCGLLVDPHDPRAIADAIEYLVSHPDEGEAMGRKGQDAVRDLYNWETQEERLLTLYQELSAR